VNRSLFGAAVAAMVAATCAAYVAPARAQRLLRHCERESPLCWRCIDVMAPLTLSCPETFACAPPGVCVTQDEPHCYASVTRCCPAFATSCELVPDCAGAGSACGDVDGDGIYDTCTSLTECPGAVPSGLVDGGVPSVLDAGPRDDGGANGDDAGLDDADGGMGMDAGPSTAPDAATDMDGGVAPKPPVEHFGFEGGGGCACSTTRGAGDLGAHGLSALASVLVLVAGRAHASRRRRGRRDHGARR